MLAPIELLGPIANYAYLRYIGGDKQLEASQDARYARDDPVKKAHLEKYRETHNAFWPDPSQLKNAWTWIVVGAGAAGVVVEQSLRAVHTS